MDAAKLVIEVTGGDSPESPPEPARYPERPPVQEQPPPVVPPPPPEPQRQPAPARTEPTPLSMPTSRPSAERSAPPVTVSIEEQKRAIVEADSGKGKSKFGFTRQILDQMGPAAVSDLYKQVAPPPEREVPQRPPVETPSRPSPTPTPQVAPQVPAQEFDYKRFHELQNRHDDELKKPLSPAEIEEWKKLRESLDNLADELGKPGAPAASMGRGAPPPPKQPTLPGFEPPEPPKRPNAEAMDVEVAYPKLPQAKPVENDPRDEGVELTTKPTAKPVRPRAEPISDHEKSAEQWTPAGAAKDLKGYLPYGIGEKFGAKFEQISGGYKAGAAEAAEAGAGKAAQIAAGVGEAATAAGPAAALVAVELANRVFAKALNRATAAVEGMGQAAAKVAKNDYMGLFNDGVEGAARTLEEIPIVGQRYAAELRLATAPIRAFTTAANAFVERGKYLAAFNSNLGAANAMANVRSTLADTREAKALGPDLSRLTDNMSQMETAIRDMLLPIKEVLVSMLAEGSAIGKETIGMLREFTPLIKFMVQVAAFMPMTMLKLLSEVMKMLHKALVLWLGKEKEPKEGDLNSMIQDFLDAGARIAGPFAPGARPAAMGGVF